MKLHAIQNGNGEKNGELFDNEMYSAYKPDSKVLRLISERCSEGLKTTTVL